MDDMIDATLSDGEQARLLAGLASMLGDENTRVGDCLDSIRAAIALTLQYGFMPNVHYGGMFERNAKTGEESLVVYIGIAAMRHALSAYNRDNRSRLYVQQEEIGRDEIASVWAREWPDTPHDPEVDRATRSRLIDPAIMRDLSADREKTLKNLQEEANTLIAMGATDAELRPLREEIVKLSTSHTYAPAWNVTRYAKNAFVVDAGKRNKTLYAPDRIPAGRTAQWVANMRGFKAAIMDTIPLAEVDTRTPAQRLRSLVDAVASAAREIEIAEEDERINALHYGTHDGQVEENGDILFAATDDDLRARLRQEIAIPNQVQTQRLAGLDNEVQFGQA
jgi:hypothetical protein